MQEREMVQFSCVCYVTGKYGWRGRDEISVQESKQMSLFILLVDYVKFLSNFLFLLPNNSLLKVSHFNLFFILMFFLVWILSCSFYYKILTCSERQVFNSMTKLTLQIIYTKPSSKTKEILEIKVFSIPEDLQ